MKKNDHLTSRRRTRKAGGLPSWIPPKTARNPERTAARVRRRIAFLLASGKSPTQIKRKLHVKNIGRLLRREDVQALVQEFEQRIFEKGEKDFMRLFLTSVKAARALLEGRPLKTGWDRPSRSMIELVWKAHGRLPQRGKGDTTVYQQQGALTQVTMDPVDAQAAMSLLKEERWRLEREREIKLDPSQIERSGGERNGP